MTAELRTFELDFLLSPGIQRLNSISSVQKCNGFKVLNKVSLIVPNPPLTEFHLRLLRLRFTSQHKDLRLNLVC